MNLVLGSGRTMQGALFLALAGSQLVTLKLPLTTSSVAGTSGLQAPGSITVLVLFSRPVIQTAFTGLLTPLYIPKAKDISMSRGQSGACCVKEERRGPGTALPACCILVISPNPAPVQ